MKTLKDEVMREREILRCDFEVALEKRLAFSGLTQDEKENEREKAEMEYDYEDRKRVCLLRVNCD